MIIKGGFRHLLFRNFAAFPPTETRKKIQIMKKLL